MSFESLMHLFQLRLGWHYMTQDPFRTDDGHHSQMFVKDPTMNPHFPPVADISNCGVWHLAGWPGHNCSIATTSDATNAPCATRRGAAAIFDGTSGAISFDQRLPTGGCISKSLVVYACLSWYLQPCRHSERWLIQISSDKSISTRGPTSEE